MYLVLIPCISQSFSFQWLSKKIRSELQDMMGMLKPASLYIGFFYLTTFLMKMFFVSQLRLKIPSILRIGQTYKERDEGEDTTG